MAPGQPYREIAKQPNLDMSYNYTAHLLSRSVPTMKGYIYMTTYVLFCLYTARRNMESHTGRFD